MLPRICIALLFALALTAAADPPPQPPSFGQRLGTILADGGTAEALRQRLGRLSREALSDDQRLAIQAYDMIVEGRGRDKDLSLQQAEAFAALHPQTGAAYLAVGHAALKEHQVERGAEAYGLAISRSPWLVEVVPAGEIDELVGRLVGRSDNDRLLALGRTLLDAGWSRGSPVSRSWLASAILQEDLRTGQIDQAIGRVADISDPQLLYGLMADNRFAAVRPEIERLWGARLEKRWREYLASYRDEWMTTGTRDAAIAYAFALQQANHHQLLVDQFMPRFMRGYNCWDDPVARRLVGYLVNSLYRLGRETKAHDVLGRMASVGGMGVWAGPSLGGILLAKGEFDRAAKVFELSLQQAAKFPGEVSPEVLVLTQGRLACANHQRGRPGTMPPTDALPLSSRVWLALCVDDEPMARGLILAALDEEDRRLAAIQWLQPFSDPPFSGSFATEMDRRIRALQSDPQVLAALRRHGAVHDWALDSAAPAEAAMRGLPVRRASPCSAVNGDPMDAVKPPESLVEGRM